MTPSLTDRKVMRPGAPSGGVRAARLVTNVLAIFTLSVVVAQSRAMSDARSYNPPQKFLALSAADVDPLRLLPPPPAPGGAAYAMDLGELHRIMAASTPDRLARAQWDDHHQDPSAYYATIGNGFDLRNLPATASLLDVVMNDQGLAAIRAKQAFPRPRPWASDKTIHTCDPNEKPLTSYPSGHATMGFSVGLVLATLIPQKAQAIQARAMDYALSREVCGSHYPSDTEASRVLGAVVAMELLKSPVLQGKIQAAKAELRTAGFTAS